MSSQKEKEILERQRRLAAQLGVSSSSSTTVSSSAKPSAHASATAASKKQPARPQQPPPPARAKTVFSLSSNAPKMVVPSHHLPPASRKKLAPPPPPPTAKTTMTSQLKRPTLKRPPTAAAAAATGASSTTDVIAAARQRAAAAKSRSNSVTSNTTTTTTTTANNNNSHKDESEPQKPPPTEPKALSSSSSLSQPNGSPRLQRKKLTTSSATTTASSSSLGGGALAKLVQNVAATAHTLGSNNHSGDSSEAAFPTIQPDDFWKHLRQWDFVSQYAKTAVPEDETDETSNDQDILTTRPKSSTTTTTSTTTTATTKALPNVFLNARHYIAAWAPLSLAECRAQLLQEAMQTTLSGTDQAAAGYRVKVESTTHAPRGGGGGGGGGSNRSYLSSSDAWMDDHERSGYVILRAKEEHVHQQTRNFSFQTNDLVLLLVPQYQWVMQDIAAWQSNNGSLRRIPLRPLPGRDKYDYSLCGLIGHALNPRNHVNGLVLQVSKQKWAKLGQDTMLMYKIGANITALREFTALCTMDRIPMKRFLLGQHLEQEEHRKKLSSHHQTTEDLLNKMGGKEALGSQFVEWARTKFNASQLTAIAASAHEYGDGGFTLIKGPPGTGSKCVV